MGMLDLVELGSYMLGLAEMGFYMLGVVGIVLSILGEAEAEPLRRLVGLESGMIS
jgi:hypothetical protein